MKRLLPIILFLSLVLGAAGAKEATRQASSKSGRSAFSVPQGWYVSFASRYQFSRIMPHETVVIADAEASVNMIPENSPIGADLLDKDFTGALLVHTVLPAGVRVFLDGTGAAIGPDKFMQAFTDSSFKEMGPLKKTYKLSGLEATSYSIRRNNKVLELLLCIDAQGNILITLAAFSADYAGQIKAVKDSFTYTYFAWRDLYSMDEPTLPIEFFKGVLEIRIPCSWWLMSLMADQLVVSPDMNIFFSLQKNPADIPGGMFIAGYSGEDINGSFKNLLKDDDITLEKLSGILRELRWNPEEMSITAIEKWQSGGSVSGLSLTGTTVKPDTGLKVAFKIFLTENRGHICIFAAVMDEAGKEAYLKLIDAIMATARWVGK